MADISNSNTSDFSTGTLDTQTALVDTDNIKKERWNAVYQAVVAIETILGATVQGTATDLKTRLATLFADIGGLRVVTSDPSPPATGIVDMIYRSDLKQLKIFDPVTASYVTQSVPDGSITTNKIADDAVTLPKIADIAATSVVANATAGSASPTAVQLTADGQVLKRSGGVLVVGQVGTAEIADGSIGTVKLITNGVQGFVLVDGSVAEPKIADAAITTAKIADAAVTLPKIADDAVTLPKIADIAATSVVANATGASASPTAVPLTADDHILKRVAGALVSVLLDINALGNIPAKSLLGNQTGLAAPISAFDLPDKFVAMGTLTGISSTRIRPFHIDVSILPDSGYPQGGGGESLRIIRGRGIGTTITQGSGFTVSSSGLDDVIVTFTDNFLTIPAVVTSGFDVEVTTQTVSAFKILGVSAGVWNFIAIGPTI